MSQAVYFIRPIGLLGPVKIGCSLMPGFRCEELERWSPFPLEIVAEIAGDFTLEARFHHKFRGSHQRQEWFTFTPALGEVMAAIKAGTFDVASLPEPKKLPRHWRRKPGPQQPASPERRYWLSATRRLRNTGLNWLAHIEPRLRKIRVCGINDWLAKRDQVEALIAELGGKPQPKARAA